MLKLEVGKTYKTRDGDLVTVAPSQRFSGFPFEGSNGVTYRETGEQLNAETPLPADLVEIVPIVPARLTLEVGKTYVTADGTPVKIVSKDDHPDLPFDGSNGDSYAPDGRWTKMCSHDGDLIEELPEPCTAALAPAKDAEDRAFFLDQLMFEIIRANPKASSQWLCHTFLALADARSQA